jgi:hypothetical protein
LAPPKELITTLIITILTEGFIAFLYCVWRKKPIRSILLTSLGANVFTQLFLWVALIIFFQHYLAALVIAESLIWIAESLALYYVSTNRLQFDEAMTLSLGMNFVSFSLGWFLRV